MDLSIYINQQWFLIFYRLERCLIGLNYDLIPLSSCCWTFWVQGNYYLIILSRIRITFGKLTHGIPNPNMCETWHLLATNEALAHSDWPVLGARWCHFLKNTIDHLSPRFTSCWSRVFQLLFLFTTSHWRERSSPSGVKPQRVVFTFRFLYRLNKWDTAC